MIKAAFVRGKFLNNFEGQNYIFNKKEINLTAISSLTSIHSRFPFPTIKLVSIADFEELPVLKYFEICKKGIKYISNRVLGDAQLLFGLEELAGRFDIFHSADPHYYYSYQLARLRSQNKIKKLIITSWEIIPFNNETVQKKKFIKKFTQKYADYFICYTGRAKESLIKEGVADNKIEVIRLGVDLNKFKLVIKQKKKNLTILFVGRLVEEKGVMDVYKAYKNICTCHCERNEVKRGNPSNVRPSVTGLLHPSNSLGIRNDIKLQIVGEGPLRNKLLQLIRRDDMEDSVLIENKTYTDMAGVYQSADIFVLPSKRTKTWEEQYGMVLIEALASGLPVIAYDTGVISEILGDSGFLVKEGNVNGLEKMLARLVKDDKLRSKIGRKARKRAEKYFDCKKTAEKISEVYKTVYNIK